jgi:hypothetical protein
MVLSEREKGKGKECKKEHVTPLLRRQVLRSREPVRADSFDKQVGTVDAITGCHEREAL